MMLAQGEPQGLVRFSCPHGLVEVLSSGLGGTRRPAVAGPTCREDLASGRLVRLFDGWSGQDGIVHIVFTTRRGLPPAVRTFIDHLAVTFRLPVTP
jgi:DNA-binding transcriptional LysR family regulator